MRLKICAVLCAAALVAAFAVPDAGAAQNQKKRVTAGKRVAVNAGPRARITVRRRSFLDPGREILPGSQHEFTDYALPPYHTPTSIIENRSGLHRSPLPGPFFPWND